MPRTRHKNLGQWPGCPVEGVLDLIDGKWKGVILYHLLNGTLRFNEIRKKLPTVTQRMLTNQLRELEADGFVVRTVFAQVPPRVDYSLSELGRSLDPVIGALKAWGDAHLDKMGYCAPVAAAKAPAAKAPAAKPATAKSRVAA
ncbi:winged helix-turn-helix transcriptional regulator [Phreatobacter stygius]|uniref:Helix-turn-helix transcriptional regulator n=1 Tax=Phreatobacter stygius TaxID=1940610 RepID=A0A4D7BJE7_9HYPH|nr:helix-turn-helix domain-containing protein [Phreatobacter stygius]QCI67902.1 helix-turn-helix transcriptional regulator [Phreatobacter stygius]